MEQTDFYRSERKTARVIKWVTGGLGTILLAGSVQTASLALENSNSLPGEFLQASLLASAGAASICMAAIANVIEKQMQHKLDESSPTV